MTTVEEGERKKIARKRRRREYLAKFDEWLLSSRSRRMIAIKGFLFPRAKWRHYKRNHFVLEGKDAENFIKKMDEPVAYNEYLTKAFEEHEKHVTSKWKEKN